MICTIWTSLPDVIYEIAVNNFWVLSLQIPSIKFTNSVYTKSWQSLIFTFIEHSTLWYVLDLSTMHHKTIREIQHVSAIKNILLTNFSIQRVFGSENVQHVTRYT